MTLPMVTPIILVKLCESQTNENKKVKLLGVTDVSGMLQRHQLTSSQLLVCVGEGAGERDSQFSSYLISADVTKVT